MHYHQQNGPRPCTSIGATSYTDISKVFKDSRLRPRAHFKDAKTQTRDRHFDVIANCLPPQQNCRYGTVLLWLVIYTWLWKHDVIHQTGSTQRIVGNTGSLEFFHDTPEIYSWDRMIWQIDRIRTNDSWSYRAAALATHGATCNYKRRNSLFNHAARLGKDTPAH